MYASDIAVSMAAVRLGRNHLRWCDACEMLVLETDVCPVCGGKSREVEITPPGDVRPAFQHDIDLIRDLADEQFGEGSGLALSLQLVPSGLWR